jgi:hypothetical protein
MQDNDENIQLTPEQAKQLAMIENMPLYTERKSAFDDLSQQGTIGNCLLLALI